MENRFEDTYFSRENHYLLNRSSPNSSSSQTSGSSIAAVDDAHV